MNTLILSLLLLGGFQDAQVVELSKTDTIQVEAAWRAKIAAEKEWEKVRKEIERKYSMATVGSGQQCISGQCPEFEFSSDFRFVVPKREKPKQMDCTSYQWLKPASVIGINQ